MLNKVISLQRIAALLSVWHSRLKQMPPVRMIYIVREFNRANYSYYYTLTY